jgi:hypothetical protein
VAGLIRNRAQAARGTGIGAGHVSHLSSGWITGARTERGVFVTRLPLLRLAIPFAEWDSLGHNAARGAHTETAWR